ncbi:hypothetical protein OG711_39025 (plasmid) [Streptomyces uncialis]|uniref:DUF7739 domain-containing protein n=1 Tax=Streptomyces uncialis TaxID=1048205 RepID=UPI002E33B4C4|nr:hypothetical protein [Streptomyces uncialis]WTE16036.1 hypothetical protein OG924_37500 [Streptomyces uncialis]
MTSHITVSHGGDFFGVDRFPTRQLRELGQYVRCVLPAADQPPLTRLLDTAGDTGHSIDSDQAALLAALLRRTAASRHIKKPYAEAAARLQAAAATAAAAPEPWTWATTDDPA